MKEECEHKDKTIFELRDACHSAEESEEVHKRKCKGLEEDVHHLKDRCEKLEH